MMSIPRGKTPNFDATSKAGSDSNVVDRSVNKTTRKSLPAVKSKIPKQGIKGPGGAVEAIPAAPPVKVAEDTAVHSTTEKQDAEEPSTPTRRSISRSQDKPSTPYLRAKSSVSTVVGGGQKRVLENLFSSKKKRYITMKKEIEDKQKSFAAIYEEMYQLREKILSSGGKDPGKLENLVPVVGKIGEYDKENDGAGEDEDSMAKLLQALPEPFVGFCKQALNKRTEIVAWLEELQRETRDDPTHFRKELNHQLSICKVENAEFQERLESARKEQNGQIKNLVNRVGQLWHECQALRLERQETTESTGQSAAVEGMTKELRTEKDKLIKARAKARELENTLASVEEKLRQSQESVKHLETQLKQKDANVDLKAKELAKCHKSNEAALSKLEKQKETVESRVEKLKQELEFKENEAKTIVSDYKKQVKDVERELEKERKMREELEAELEEFKIRYVKLEEKCKQLLEVQERKNEDISDDYHTEYEIQLYNDLKDTQHILAEKEELIKKLEVEREEIIAAVNEADQENDTSKQRLSAELLKKSNELLTMRTQFAQLQKNYKRTQQKSEHLEHKLQELNRMQVQMKDGSRAAYSAQVMQLQQQLTDARSNLSDLGEQNVELQKNCTQLQMKLERYKRYMRNQDKGIKVRMEMQQLLQNKDAEDQLDPNDVNQYSSINTEEFQELYAALEKKEMQVMKLEKLVKQMEKQEDCSQAQRTRLENRIAKLEFALKEAQQAHRNRGFSFL